MRPGDFVESTMGALRGRALEIIKIEDRYGNVHGDLVLCETGLGQRYWLRSTNLRKAEFS